MKLKYKKLCSFNKKNKNDNLGKDQKNSFILKRYRVHHSLHLLPFLVMLMYGCTKGCISWLLLNTVISLITIGGGLLFSGVYSFSATLPAPPSAIETTWTDNFFLALALWLSNSWNWSYYYDVPFYFYEKKIKTKKNILHIPKNTGCSQSWVVYFENI